jgi:hypothetical protein
MAFKIFKYIFLKNTVINLVQAIYLKADRYIVINGYSYILVRVQYVNKQVVKI